jgi:acyl carrier protein
MTDKGSIRSTIQRVLSNVLQDAGREIPEFADDALLADTILLDSLDFAVVIVNLERELGVDPFRKSTQRIRTFGELVDLYEESVAS